MERDGGRERDGRREREGGSEGGREGERVGEGSDTLPRHWEVMWIHGGERRGNDAHIKYEVNDLDIRDCDCFFISFM